MGSLNKVMLIGNLGRDAEMRHIANGTAVSTLNLATTETWKDKEGNKQEKTEWHRIIVWGKTAEALSQYLVKGKQILVEGKLQTRQWEKDGVTRYTTEIKSDRITLLGERWGSATRATSAEVTTMRGARNRSPRRKFLSNGLLNSAQTVVWH